MRGSPETGWFLTPLGEEVADECLQRWDEYVAEVTYHALLVFSYSV
jgi:hypothetical protein